MNKWIGIVLVLGLLLSGCGDKGEISSQLYSKVAADVVKNGGDPQFSINYIEVKGDTAEISYDLLGNTYKTSAIKTSDGTWVVR